MFCNGILPKKKTRKRDFEKEAQEEQE